MINSFKIFVEVALNKNQMGKPSPSDFNHALARAEQKNYNELFADFRKFNYRKSRMQSTQRYGDEARFVQQAMEYYIKEGEVGLTDGRVIVADQLKDIHLLDSVFSNKTEVELVELKEYNLLTRNRLQPTNCTPIATYNDGTLKVFPAHEKVDVTYFRNLKMPRWTYMTEADGRYTFDPDQNGFQDLDIHPLLYEKVFVDTLGLLGLNIKEEFAMQYVAQMKQEEQIDKQ